MIEHRVYSHHPPQEKHNHESTHCWCEPTVEHYGEDTLVTHNDISDFLDDDGYYEVPSQIGH